MYFSFIFEIFSSILFINCHYRRVFWQPSRENMFNWRSILIGKHFVDNVEYSNVLQGFVCQGIDNKLSPGTWYLLTAVTHCSI